VTSGRVSEAVVVPLGKGNAVPQLRGYAGGVFFSRFSRCLVWMGRRRGVAGGQRCTAGGAATTTERYYAPRFVDDAVTLA